MLAKHYDLLQEAAAKHDYMSVAIGADDSPIQSIPVPWERTMSAFNMRTPKLSLSADDLHDPSVMQALKGCTLIGCYIMAPLDDYGFIASFSSLQDLFIRHGERLHDLSFIRPLTELFMFYVADASLPSLQPLVDACNENPGGPGRCFAFNRCAVTDTSALSDVHFVLSELLVRAVEGDERGRWESPCRPGIFRFYENNL